jgi:lipoprotein NlpD
MDRLGVDRIDRAARALPEIPQMNRSLRTLAPLALLIAGCASEQPAPVVDYSIQSSTPVAPTAAAPASGSYRVVRGDTLYAIAFKHGVDYRDLAAWNRIAAPYRIFTGQELQLSAPVAPASARVETAPVAAAKPITALPEPAPGAAVTAGISEQLAAPSAPAFEDVPPQTPTVAAEPAQPTQTSTAATPAVAPPPVKTIVEATPPKPVAETPGPPKSTAPKPTETAHADNTPELSSGGVTWRWPSDGKIIAAYVSGEPTRQGVDISGKAGDPVHAAADGEVVYSGNGLIGYGELIIVKHNASFLSAYGHNRARLVKEGDKVKAGQAIAEMGSSASSRDELHFEIRKNGKPVNPLEYLPAR